MILGLLMHIKLQLLTFQKFIGPWELLDVLISSSRLLTTKPMLNN